MKTIRKIEPCGSRMKIYLDEEETFVLYKGEVRKFHLEENTELTEDVFDNIMELLYERGKERALYILEGSYKTTKQIRDKLKQGLYPELVIEKVIAFLLEYNFVNDEQYAFMYIEYKSESKSRRQITQDLVRKGISKEIIDSALSDSGFSDDTSLSKMIEKRISRYNLNDRKDLQKFYQYLIGKGYSYNDVKNALREYIDVEQSLM